jgi:hypothetical protein
MSREHSLRFAMSEDKLQNRGAAPGRPFGYF